MEDFDLAVDVLRKSHGHRSWWPALEDIFAALKRDVMAIRSELLEKTDDHDDRLHQLETHDYE